MGVTAVFYALLALAALVWIGWQGRPNVLLADDAATALRAAGPGLLAGLAVVAAGRALRGVWKAARDLEAGFRAILGRRSLAEIALLALFSGVAEEVFFRGAMQPALGLVATSLIFGAVHFLPRRPFFLWTPFAIAVGFLLGGLYEWTGSIWAPVATHVSINALNLWWICGGGAPPGAWASPEPPPGSPPDPSPSSPAEEAAPPSPSPPPAPDGSGPPGRPA